MTLLQPPFRLSTVARDSIPFSVSMQNATSDEMTQTVPSSGNMDLWTFSCWFKLAQGAEEAWLLSGGTTNDSTRLWVATDGSIHYNHKDSSATTDELVTTQLLRDHTAWYHLVCIYDSLNATAGDRIRLYLNGVRITDFSTTNNPASGKDSDILNSAKIMRIGERPNNADNCDCYLAEVHLVDGVANEPTDFGMFDTVNPNIWIHKTFAGSHGTEGSYLDFSNSADYGSDQSGNANDWTDAGLTTASQSTDTPTNNRSMISANYLSGTSTILVGATDVNMTANDGVQATFPLPTSGKWYWEVKLTGDNGTGSSGRFHAGIKSQVQFPDLSNTDATNDAPHYSLFSSSGSWRDSDGTTLNTDTTPANFDVGATLGFAYDADTGEFWGGHDEGAHGVTMTWQGITGALSPDPATGTDPSYTIGERQEQLHPYATATSTATAGAEIYFNEDDWLFAAPTGFKALATANMPEPDVLDPTDAFVQVLADEDNILADVAAARAGWGDYIDFFKNRDSVEQWIVRFSDDASNMMNLDNTNAAAAISAFSGSDNWLGSSMRVGSAYGLFTVEVAHTNGADTDTAHGLTASDSGQFMGVVKISNTTGSWYCTHPHLSAGYNFLLDTTAVEQNSTVYASVDATNITVNSAAPTGTYRVICWAEKTGLISMDAYEGSGGADGATVALGGKPAWLWVKKRTTTATSIWAISSTVDTYNLGGSFLLLDTTAVEAAPTGNNSADILAGGFKARGTGGNINTAGIPYVTFAYLEGALGGVGVPPMTAH